MESSRSYPPRPLLPALKTAPQPPQAPSPLKLFLCDSQGLGGRVGALLRLGVFRTGIIERRSRLLFGLSLSVSIRPFLSDRLPGRHRHDGDSVRRSPARAEPRNFHRACRFCLLLRCRHIGPPRSQRPSSRPLLPARLKPAPQQAPQPFGGRNAVQIGGLRDLRLGSLRTSERDGVRILDAPPLVRASACANSGGRILGLASGHLPGLPFARGFHVCICMHMKTLDRNRRTGCDNQHFRNQPPRGW